MGKTFFFTINVDLQQWVALDFNDCIAPFSALVVSRELLAQLSLEQTAEEIKRKTDVFIKYFDNENKAFNWVKSIKVHTNFNQEQSKKDSRSQVRERQLLSVKNGLFLKRMFDLLLFGDVKTCLVLKNYSFFLLISQH
eukprot:TRINITY_DN24410_c0_g1_i1.p1 TRINITY_DN24410_c0_g1~~TRINITY_DN24410_c0_g1_i1.p1  ORF type:complete len:138 (+),score=11.59 TRINITY_DN24410_c0_g1_i1:221-634(+)